MIVAFEGIDGSGKATQAKMLAERIGARVFSFPNYESETGKLILGNLQQRWVAAEAQKQEFLKLSTYQPLIQGNARVLQSLFAINRYELSGEIERVDMTQHVVLDRYWLSGVVYGVCDGLDEEWLVRIHACLPQPNVWILLDVSPEDSVRRRPERRDRYEKDANMGRRRESLSTLVRRETRSLLRH